jgi:hypothetical protein
MTVAASGLLPAGPLDELFLHIEVVIDKGLDRLVDGDRQWISKTEQPGYGSRDGLADNQGTPVRAADNGRGTVVGHDTSNCAYLAGAGIPGIARG